MGRSTQVDGDNNPTSAESDPAKLLEAALEQMDGIIAVLPRGKYVKLMCRYSFVYISSFVRSLLFDFLQQCLVSAIQQVCVFHTDVDQNTPLTPVPIVREGASNPDKPYCVWYEEDV
ncbi:unnamed protein product [Pieris macdunnoughi]|uniref:Uncharacterized protein n=1 Tax=Pieris macdunnoughi TaxID=345717 RepID=A0A821S993_9NEOP|nr:unnamed protein product [Pieris macdunnoughi]